MGRKKQRIGSSKGRVKVAKDVSGKEELNDKDDANTNNIDDDTTNDNDNDNDGVMKKEESKDNGNDNDTNSDNKENDEGQTTTTTRCDFCSKPEGGKLTTWDHINLLLCSTIAPNTRNDSLHHAMI
jgi:hypothetical protein